MSQMQERFAALWPCSGGTDGEGVFFKKHFVAGSNKTDNEASREISPLEFSELTEMGNRCV
ncbi:hypothetical protein [Burkholderia sp. RF2-non_BP3]|uniref:hypothetical protein n=1 Tax=Burkholderia sp. RF2-non_BP3 TaxID=1637844 RepID=UPI000B25C02F|nr:hypothetical protein [Burkholderia sp. RF2-non_BP3]